MDEVRTKFEKYVGLFVDKEVSVLTKQIEESRLLFYGVYPNLN